GLRCFVGGLEDAMFQLTKGDYMDFGDVLAGVHKQPLDQRCVLQLHPTDDRRGVEDQPHRASSFVAWAAVSARLAAMSSSKAPVSPVDISLAFSTSASTGRRLSRGRISATRSPRFVRYTTSPARTESRTFVV